MPAAKSSTRELPAGSAPPHGKLCGSDAQQVAQNLVHVTDRQRIVAGIFHDAQTRSRQPHREPFGKSIREGAVLRSMPNANWRADLFERDVPGPRVNLRISD